MSSFVINGGKPLFGSITVGGSKNAALPIIFASVAVNGVSIIENVPDISDIDVALSLIEALGARTERFGASLKIDARNLSYIPSDAANCSAIRASTYLIGAELARFGKTELSAFGGCNFEPRPIDLHIYAAKCLGAKEDGRTLVLAAPQNAKIVFEKVSVGATANALILSSALPVTTEIFGYAKEPHIFALAEFLSSAGAKIEFCEEKILVVGTTLSSARATVPPDPIETGTFALLSLATGGKIAVKGADPSELKALFSPLIEVGAKLDESERGTELYGSLSAPLQFTAKPYPGLATDLQPLIVPTLARFCGGVVRDTVFAERFGYVTELERFGLKAERIFGGVKISPSVFRCAKAAALDLRGGAALLFPTLIAEGQSVISSAELIKRGYSDIIEKLTRLGACIFEE